MTKRLATIVAAGATVLGAMGLTAPTAIAATTAAVPAITCGNHNQVTGTTRYSYYGNCAGNAVNVHVYLTVLAPGSDLPQTYDEGEHCVPAQTDYLMGTSLASLVAFYTGYDSGTC